MLIPVFSHYKDFEMNILVHTSFHSCAGVSKRFLAAKLKRVKGYTRLNLC